MEFFVKIGTKCTVQDAVTFILNSEKEEIEIFVLRSRDIPGLLKLLGIYRSTSQARQAGRTGEFKTGYQFLRASKKDFVHIIK